MNSTDLDGKIGTSTEVLLIRCSKGKPRHGGWPSGSLSLTVGPLTAAGDA